TVSGLPGGVTGSFSPASLTAPGSSTLDLNVGSTAATGTYPVTISGTSSGLARSAALSLVVTAPAAGTTTYEAETLAIAGTSGDAVQTNSEAGFSNGQAVQYNATGAGDYITFQVPNVTAGTYNVIIGVKKYTARGMMQVSAGNSGGTLVNVGGVSDLYNGTTVYTSFNLGNWTTAASG